MGGGATCVLNTNIWRARSGYKYKGLHSLEGDGQGVCRIPVWPGRGARCVKNSCMAWKGAGKVCVEYLYGLEEGQGV